MFHEIDRVFVGQRSSYDLAHRLMATRRAAEQKTLAIEPTSETVTRQRTQMFVKRTFMRPGILLILLAGAIVSFALR